MSLSLGRAGRASLPMRDRASAAAQRTSRSESVRILPSAVTAGLAWLPMRPRAIAAAPRTSTSLSLRASIRSGIAGTALSPSLPSSRAACRRTEDSVSLSASMKAFTRGSALSSESGWLDSLDTSNEGLDDPPAKLFVKNQTAPPMARTKRNARPNCAYRMKIVPMNRGPEDRKPEDRRRKERRL